MEAVSDAASSVKEYDRLILWIGQRLDILGFPDSTWSEGSNNAIIDFVTGEGPKILSVI